MAIKTTDISSLYLDDGYLFFNANLLKPGQKTMKLILKLESMKTSKARINKIRVNGNTKTNDHVIMREIRTKP